MQHFLLLIPTLSTFVVGFALGPGSTAVAAEDIQAAKPVSPADASDAGKPKFVTQSIRGRVTWMSEGLKRRHGVSLVPEAQEQLLALETRDGRLLPIMEDARGRSFRIDERLRAMDLELMVRQYHGSPMIQVIRVYAWEKGAKHIVDYWCDICAITMFQSGPCDCCQDQNHLRKRPVAAGQGGR